MRILNGLTLSGVIALALGAGIAHAASTTLIINEAYVGGGASTGSPAYQRDFIELYNLTSSTISLSGYSLQYAAATGNFNAGGNVFAFGATDTIAPKGYFLVNSGTTGTAGAVNPVGNASAGLNLSATSGKLALVLGTTNLGTVTGNVPSGTSLGGQFIVDFVGYGTTADAREGAAIANNAPTPTSTAVSLTRTNFTDTDNNANDFTVLATPTPQSSVVVTVPEAGTVSLLAFGFAGLAGLVARRRAAK